MAERLRDADLSHDCSASLRITEWAYEQVEKASGQVWVAQTIGDGLGFDVLSFDELDDSERLIEVKTTGLGKYFPFYVTGNELRCSEDVEQQFHLYRVFDFARTPRLFVLRGSLRMTCQLKPVQFRATI